MNFSDIASVLEICKLKNLTVWKFVIDMCAVLRSQLLQQVQVELEEYMQICTVRAPFLGALRTGTVDDATSRISIKGTVMAEWRVNRRVRKLTAMLQREILKRQADERHVPCCSVAWIYQDFPSLLSETKAESLPLSVLCDHILKRYDLTKDNEFRDLHSGITLELQQHNDQLTQRTQNVNQYSHYPSHVPTSSTPRDNVGQYISTESSLPLRADWFRHYQPAKSHTDAPLFGATEHSAEPDIRARHHYKISNNQRHYNGQDSRRHMSTFDSSRCSASINSSANPYMAKTAEGSKRFNGPEVQRHTQQYANHTNVSSFLGSTDSFISRKTIKPQQTNEQNCIPKSLQHALQKTTEETRPKSCDQKKSFNEKIDEYLARACPTTPKVDHSENKSPTEFSSAHMGGLVIKIAKKPTCTKVNEPQQPKKEFGVKERKRQAFLDHVARIQKKLKDNMKAEVQCDNSNPRKRKAPESSVCDSVQTKCHKVDSSSSATVEHKDNPRKRKDTDASLCTSIQTKCARLDTDSAIKALKRHVVKRQQ